MPGRPTRDLVLTLTDAGETFQGRVVSLLGGMPSQSMKQPSRQGGALSFDVHAGEPMTFRGRIRDGALAGTVVTGSGETGVFLVESVSAPPMHGDITVLRGRLPIGIEDPLEAVVTLRPSEGDPIGWLDVPAHRVYGYPIQVRRGPEGVVLLELPSPRDNGVVTLAIDLSSEDISAFWGRGSEVVAVRLNRQQTGTRVQLQAEGVPDLHGVLPTPSSPPPWPVVVMVGDGGSGAGGVTDGVPTLRVLSDRCVRDGLATLRLDDPDTTFKARQRAIRRWMEYLIGDERFLRHGIALLGHGQGGNVVGRYGAAFGRHVMALALVGAPGMSGRAIELDREADGLRAAGADEEGVEAALASLDRLFEFTLLDVNDDALREAATSWIQQRSEAAGGNVASLVIEDVVAKSKDPEWRDWIGYDPRVAIPRLDGIEVLAVQGLDDDRFNGPANLAALQAAAASRGVSLDGRLLEGCDGAMQSELIDVDGLVSTWLLERLRPNEEPSP